MWRTVRITILMIVLAIVAVGNWLDRERTRSWDHTVQVGAFPVNADGSAAAIVPCKRLPKVRRSPLAFTY